MSTVVPKGLPFVKSGAGIIRPPVLPARPLGTSAPLGASTTATPKSVSPTQLVGSPSNPRLLAIANRPSYPAPKTSAVAAALTTTAATTGQTTTTTTVWQVTLPDGTVKTFSTQAAAQAYVKESTAAFVAPYMGMWGKPILEAMEVMLMIRPPGGICGTTA